MDTSLQRSFLLGALNRETPLGTSRGVVAMKCTGLVLIQVAINGTQHDIINKKYLASASSRARFCRLCRAMVSDERGSKHGWTRAVICDEAFMALLLM